ncbi:MAG TPA: TonB-dependent receptor, partial [Rhodothermales bacterium]|nr:TonB-dependent receptor [Rhodothermales bacterium]
MKLATRMGLLCLLLGLLVPAAFAQRASITGVVTDAADGAPLLGANVVVTVPGAVSMVGGAATGADGRYTVSALEPGDYVVTFRFIGYGEQQMNVTLSAGETRTLDVALSPQGFDLEAVVVTASRRQEKVLDAPASISVLDAQEISQDVSTSSVEALRNTTGVDMAQTGIDRREVVLRGFNNAFSGAAYVLTDYRQSAVPSLAVNLYSIMPNMTIDVERVEVVRGPGSALYGAGVDAGVVHFITKDPFQHPGTTVAISGGERSFFSFQGRHAGVVNDKVGYKITGQYGRADDWALDPNDPEDAQQLSDDKTARNNDFEKLNVNASVEYRISDETSIIANGGFSSLTATVLSGIGTLQADGFGYSYGQLRFQSGAFFAQAYLNKNNAGDSFVYAQDLNNDGVPDPVTDKGLAYNVQAQYDLDFLDGRQQVIVGADLEVTRPNTEGTILGRNEDDDNTTEYGAYVQSTTALTSQFDLTAALRGDYNDVNEKFRLSPRAALVYKVMPAHSVRATYNLAFSSPGTNSNFLDIVARSPDAELPFLVRGRGTYQGFTWERNPDYAAFAPTDLVASSLNGCFPTPTPTCGAPVPQGLPLDVVYASFYAGLAAIPTATLTAQLQAQGLPVNEQVVAQLVALLSPEAGTNVQGFSQGVLGILNTSAGTVDKFPTDLVDIDPLKQTTTQTAELGYKGLFGNRLLLAVDGYYSKKKDFIGPLLMETPFVLVPNINNDLRAAISAGISGNATLAGALGQFGLTAEQVAGLLVALGADQLPSGSSPVAIV